MFGCVEAACGDAPRSERLGHGLEALLGWIADKPTYAWTVLVEAQQATPESLERYVDATNRAADLLSRAHADQAPAPPLIELALAGGVAAVLSNLVRDGEADTAPGLLPDLEKILATPYAHA